MLKFVVYTHYLAVSNEPLLTRQILVNFQSQENFQVFYFVLHISSILKCFTLLFKCLPNFHVFNFVFIIPCQPQAFFQRSYSILKFRTLFSKLSLIFKFFTLFPIYSLSVFNISSQFSDFVVNTSSQLVEFFLLSFQHF